MWAEKENFSAKNYKTERNSWSEIWIQSNGKFSITQTIFKGNFIFVKGINAVLLFVDTKSANPLILCNFIL